MWVLGLVDLPWWTIILLLLAVFYLYETRHFNFFKNQGIPFVQPYPLIGTMYLYTKGMQEGDLEVVRRHKNEGYVGGFLGDRPLMIVWDEKFLADVMVKESNNFINHMKPYRQGYLGIARYPRILNFQNFSDPGSLGSMMLFNMEDHKWKTARNEMSPTFTTGKLKAMNSEIDRCAKAVGEFLLEQADIGEPIEIKEYIGGFTMDVIASTAFGIQLNSGKDKDNAFVKNAKNFMEGDLSAPRFIFSMYFPKLTSLLQKLGFSFEPMMKEPMAFFSNITKQAIEIRKADNDQSRTDFLQIMVNAERDEGGEGQDEKISGGLKGMSTEEIVANAAGFFQGGYDTTSSTLSFLMYSLATNPDIQTRLIEEIDQVVLDMDSVSYSVLQDMPYLEKCINETLRMYPAAISTNRVARTDMRIQGVFIKKDMAVMIPIFALHRHPERWPDPERFDPERFSTENKGKRNLYHYIPFGAGPRMCLGMRLALQEMKMAVIHILKRVTVETCEKTEIPVRFENHFMLKPADLWLKVVRR